MINLQVFCSTWNLKYKFPWSWGDYTFATDGSIIVRVPRVVDILDNANSPDAIKLWKNVLIFGDPALIPELSPSEIIRCEDCFGESKAAIRECEECQGTGMVHNRYTTIIGGMIYDDKYLKLIKALPIYKFYPVQFNFSQVSDALPSLFTFDGGDGILMPVVKRSWK